MASTRLAGYEETVICPYNKCHVILRHRFQTHLVKCARSYPDIKLEMCPFDSTHRFPEDEKAVRYFRKRYIQMENMIFTFFHNSNIDSYRGMSITDQFRSVRLRCDYEWHATGTWPSTTPTILSQARKWWRRRILGSCKQISPPLNYLLLNFLIPPHFSLLV